MKKNYFEEMAPEERRIVIGLFSCFSVLFLICVALVIAVIISRGVYARKANIPQPTTLIYSPSGKIYHHGDNVDLNDFLYQFETEHNKTFTHLKKKNKIGF